LLKGQLLGDPVTDDVVSAAQAGDANAFNVIYREIAPAVGGYLRAKGVLDPDAVTNDVFLAVLPRLSDLSGGATGLRTFVFSVAHARAVDETRRRQRQPTTTEYDATADWRAVGSAETEAMTAFGTERVLTMLAALSAEQRDVLTLRVVADLTVDEVAAIIGRSAGAVKQLQRRALIALRQRLAEQDVTL
jgi:RNA polymerase sigma factor (sigma-70 family)